MPREKDPTPGGPQSGKLGRGPPEAGAVLWAAPSGSCSWPVAHSAAGPGGLEAEADGRIQLPRTKPDIKDICESVRLCCSGSIDLCSGK